MGKHNQCDITTMLEELTTGVAIMPMFVSDNGKLLESTNTFDRPNITKRQRFSSTKTLRLNSVHISTLRFKIQTNKPAFTDVKERETAAIRWQIHSEKGSGVLGD
jgi:hypothetical protein